MHLDPLKRVSEPMSKAGTWSFDTPIALHPLRSLAYNYPPSAGVGEKNFSFTPALPSPEMSVEASNSSRSPSRKLRQSFSEQISDIKTKLVRALSAERPNPSNDGSSQYSKIGGESLLQRDHTCPTIVGRRGTSVSEGAFVETHSP